MGKQVDFRLSKVASPPEGEPWLWHTLELRASPAWMARSNQLSRMLEMLELEHLRHGGSDNGHLKQPYSQIEAAGIPRKFIAATIAEGEGLGLIVAVHGVRKSSTESYMTTFRLTYLPAKVSNAGYQDGKPYYTAPTNEWKKITPSRAAVVAERASIQRSAASGRAKNRKCHPQREPNQYPNGNSGSSPTGTGFPEHGGNAGAELGQSVPQREHPSISWQDAAYQNHPAATSPLPEPATSPSKTSPPTNLDQPSTVQAGQQCHRQGPTKTGGIERDHRQVDLVDWLNGAAASEKPAPVEQLRADLTAFLERSPKGEANRVAQRLGLSRPQIVNFKAGRFGLNPTAASALREYLKESVA